MRVIAGLAKGRTLRSVPGESTRPITDRAKEALFSILGDEVGAARVLDLFGGTGGVGIEALSRGAAFAQFVERNPRAVATIRANLTLCRMEQQATVTPGDSFRFLDRYNGEPYDLIFVAPPQYAGLWIKALHQIDRQPLLLAGGGTVVVQIDPREVRGLSLARLIEVDRRRYGSVLLLFYAPRQGLVS